MPSSSVRRSPASTFSLMRSNMGGLFDDRVVATAAGAPRAIAVFVVREHAVAAGVANERGDLLAFERARRDHSEAFHFLLFVFANQETALSRDRPGEIGRAEAERDLCELEPDA